MIWGGKSAGALGGFRSLVLRFAGTGAHGLPPRFRRTSWSTHGLPPWRSARARVDYLAHLGLGGLHAEIGDDPGRTGLRPWFRVVARRDVHDQTRTTWPEKSRCI